MKYPFSAPASKVPYQGEITIPDLPPSVTPSFSGVVPIDDVPPQNQPPTANAGSDTEITLPNNTVILDGRGSDPEGNAVSFLWVKFSGSGNLLAPNAARCEVAGLTEGVSIFRLTTKDDKGASSTPDDVRVTVRPAVVIPPTTPGKYEGFGSQAIGGGNSSDVRTVKTQTEFFNNLGNNRTIKFGSNCTITKAIYTSNLQYCTIDANGFDVTFENIDDDGISFEGSNAHHNILTGIRVRNCTGDGINVVGGAHDIVIDHCSVSECGDGLIDVAGGKNVTIQWCLMGKGLSGWSGATLGTCITSSWLYNLINPATPGSVGERCPLIHAAYDPGPQNPNADIRMNVIMNFGRSGGTGSGYGTSICHNARGNVVNNYYYDKESASKAICKDDGYGSGNNGQIYSAGNHITTGSTILSATMANNHAEFPIPAQYKPAMVTALEAKAKVKAEVGPAVKNTYEKGLIASI